MTKLLVFAALVSGLVFGEEQSKDNRVKGAIIGAAVGGVAGLIIDQMNKKRDAEPKKLMEF